jgi:hypothetical protein
VETPDYINYLSAIVCGGAAGAWFCDYGETRLSATKSSITSLRAASFMSEGGRVSPAAVFWVHKARMRKITKTTTTIVPTKP